MSHPEESTVTTGSIPALSAADLGDSSITGPFPVADSLTVRSEAAAAVGSVLLAGGMASYRVKWGMARTARQLGLDSFVSVVSFTDITATATLNGRYRTRITRPEHVGVNVDHLYRTQRMVEEMPENVSATEIFDELAKITARGPLHSAPMNALAAALACAAFAFLNQGGPAEMVAVFFAAGLGQAARRRLQHRQWNHMLITLIAAVISSTLYFAFFSAAANLAAVPAVEAGGYLSAVLYLVPGFPLITGILDLVRSDFAAGLARLSYVALMLIGAGSAVWVVSEAFGVESSALPPLDLDFGPMLVLRALATAVGVLGFALIFNSPWKIALTAAGVSAVANSVRFALTSDGVAPQLATLLATVLVGITAYGIARTWHVPRTAISVPAVVIMIPGFTIYGALSLLQNGNVVGGLLAGMEAIQVILAAALGLALAHLATSPAWRRTVSPK